MSAPLSSAEVLFLQRRLSCAGFNPGKLDGVPGPKTDAAAALWDAAFVAIRTAEGELDGRTEACLRTILPDAQRVMRRLLKLLAAAGIDARAISGTRTYAEQDALFRKGRYGDDPKNQVTRARGGQSNHNFALAIDIGIFVAGKYLQESPLYAKAGALSVAVAGLEWGGNWRDSRGRPIPDRPHHQLATGLPLAEVRRRFEAGEAYVTSG